MSRSRPRDDAAERLVASSSRRQRPRLAPAVGWAQVPPVIIHYLVQEFLTRHEAVQIINTNRTHLRSVFDRRAGGWPYRDIETERTITNDPVFNGVSDALNEWKLTSLITDGAIRFEAHSASIMLDPEETYVPVTPQELRGHRKIVLGHDFDQPLTGLLPTSVTDLSLGVDFDLTIEPGDLPVSLVKLVLSVRYNHSFAPGSLPLHLASISFQQVYNQPFVVGGLPDSLQVLAFGDRTSGGVLLSSFNHSLSGGLLPRHLVRLTIAGNFNHPFAVGDLPPTLQILFLGARFNHVFLPGVLPQSLRVLLLDGDFDQPFGTQVLPDGLIQLGLRGNYDQPFAAGVLPDSIRGLGINSSFNHPFAPGRMPRDLKRLMLKGDFNQALGPGVLPDGIDSLSLGVGYQQVIELDQWPASLRRLTRGGRGDWQGVQLSHMRALDPIVRAWMAGPRTNTVVQWVIANTPLGTTITATLMQTPEGQMSLMELALATRAVGPFTYINNVHRP